MAVGIRDMVGTGFAGAEYIVASKEVGGFDVTVGMGWGRLAGNGDFENPYDLASQILYKCETVMKVEVVNYLQVLFLAAKR